MTGRRPSSSHATRHSWHGQRIPQAMETLLQSRINQSIQPRHMLEVPRGRDQNPTEHYESIATRPNHGRSKQPSSRNPTKRDFYFGWSNTFPNRLSGYIFKRSPEERDRVVKVEWSNYKHLPKRSHAQSHETNHRAQGSNKNSGNRGSRSIPKHPSTTSQQSIHHTRTQQLAIRREANSGKDKEAYQTHESPDYEQPLQLVDL